MGPICHPLPFGRMAIAMGEPIKVKKGAEDEARLRLENTLNDITAKHICLQMGHLHDRTSATL